MAQQCWHQCMPSFTFSCSSLWPHCYCSCRCRRQPINRVTLGRPYTDPPGCHACRRHPIGNAQRAADLTAAAGPHTDPSTVSSLWCQACLQMQLQAQATHQGACGVWCPQLVTSSKRRAASTAVRELAFSKVCSWRCNCMDRHAGALLVDWSTSACSSTSYTW